MGEEKVQDERTQVLANGRILQRGQSTKGNRNKSSTWTFPSIVRSISHKKRGGPNWKNVQPRRTLIYNNNMAQNRHNNSKSIITLCKVLALFYFILFLNCEISSGKISKKEAMFFWKGEMPPHHPHLKEWCKIHKGHTMIFGLFFYLFYEL